ncbi:MAG TPA: 2-dehydropantoate 2-reductase [Burkholderiales bacterium]|nr:2-dehydropantoate 2-reductase [Burkholderiales bacterium]
MRFVIAGAGGVGGNLGVRLAEAGHEVSWLARGANLAALRAGVRLESPLGTVALGPQRAEDDPQRLDPPDALIVAVKMYALAGLAPQLAPIAGPQTLVVPLQNGVEAHGVLAAALPAAKVLKGMVSVKASLKAPGVIECKSGFCRVKLGGAGAEPLAAALRTGKGVETSVAADMDAELWRKFVMLSSFSAVSCLARATIGEVLDDPPAYRQLLDAADEAVRVARASGVELGADVQELVQSQVRDLPKGGKPSMLEDLEAGRALELDFLSGAVVRLGERHGVATPFHLMASRVLAMHKIRS